MKSVPPVTGSSRSPGFAALNPGYLLRRPPRSGVVVRSRSLVGRFGTERVQYRREYDGNRQVENQRVKRRITRERPAAERQRIGGGEIDRDRHAGAGQRSGRPSDQQSPRVKPSRI